MKVTTDSCLFGAWVASNIQNLKNQGQVLDIGSGTGLLSLMIAQQTQCFIDGIEIQEQDYLQSLENISASIFKNRIVIYNHDAKDFTYNKKYDAIICNPPFYENDLKSSDEGKNIAHHDEFLRLNDLIGIIKKHLAVDGLFYILIPAKRNFEDLIKQTGLFINQTVFVKQTEKHQPFRMMIKGSFMNEKKPDEEIIIKENNLYTKNFINLLKPYYLDF